MSGIHTLPPHMAPTPVKLLIASDEPQFFLFISRMTAGETAVRIIGKTGMNSDVLSKKSALKPDLVILDLADSPDKGFEIIEGIMASDASPILVIVAEPDAVHACRAISKGALEVASRAEVAAGSGNDFVRRIMMLSRIKVISHIRSQAYNNNGTKAAPVLPKSSPAALSRKPVLDLHSSRQVLAIASSTGGPKALHQLLSGLPPDFPCPVVIAQHMADDFIRGMAEWLDRNIPLKVKAGQAGEVITGGTVYFSPSERHMKIDSRGRIGFEERKPRDIYFPSCDILLTSIARAFSSNSIGVILTGMGSDGALGIKAIREAGGATIAQDEETSVVFGMPGTAIKTGCVDKVLPIQKIASAVLTLIRNRVDL